MTIRKRISCVAGVLLTAAGAAGQKADVPVYRDPHASTQARTADLLKRMSLEEKVAQLSGGWNLPSMGGASGSVFKQTGLDDALTKQMAGQGLGTYAFLDEFLGGPESANPKVGAERRNLLQAWVLKNTRLGIPILFHGEALHGAVRQGATLFPAPIGLGSTWDRALIQKTFGTVAQESRAAGNALVLAPVLDLIRDPRYGRVQEMYSEDTYLVAQLGTAAVKGLQGPSDTLDEDHVFATAKHFVHGQPENGTNVGPSDFSERTMRSVFLYQFEQAVKKGHIEAIMPSYNETDGGVPQTRIPGCSRMSSERSGASPA